MLAMDLDGRKPHIQHNRGNATVLHFTPASFAEHHFASHRREFYRKFVASPGIKKPDDDALGEQK
jgi:hypothetical protein